MKINSEVALYSQIVKAKYDVDNENGKSNIRWGKYHTNKEVRSASAVFVEKTPSWLSRLGFERVIIYDKKRFMNSQCSREDMMALTKNINQPIAIITEPDKNGDYENYGAIRVLSIQRIENQKNKYYSAVVKINSYYDSVLDPCYASRIMEYEPISKREFDNYMLSVKKDRENRLNYFDAKRYQQLEINQLDDFKEQQSVKRLIRSNGRIFNSIYMLPALTNRDIRRAATVEVNRLFGIEEEKYKRIHFDVYREAIAVLLKANETPENMFSDILQAKQIVDKTYDLLKDNKDIVTQARQYTDTLFAGAYAQCLDEQTRIRIDRNIDAILGNISEIRENIKDEKEFDEAMEYVQGLNKDISDLLGYDIVLIQAQRLPSESMSSFQDRKQTIENGQEAINSLLDIKSKVNRAIDREVGLMQINKPTDKDIQYVRIEKEDMELA